jgi:hypothetical protein
MQECLLDTVFYNLAGNLNGFVFSGWKITFERCAKHYSFQKQHAIIFGKYFNCTTSGKIF